MVECTRAGVEHIVKGFGDALGWENKDIIEVVEKKKQIEGGKLAGMAWIGDK